MQRSQRQARSPFLNHGSPSGGRWDLHQLHKQQTAGESSGHPAVSLTLEPRCCSFLKYSALTLLFFFFFFFGRRNKNCKVKPTLPKVRHVHHRHCRVVQREQADRLVFFPQHLLDVKSLRYLSSVTLHDRITKSLLHLHKKKKPPSISAQFQVRTDAAP